VARDSLRFRCIVNDDGDGLKRVAGLHDVSQVAGPMASLTGTPAECLCGCVAGEHDIFTNPGAPATNCGKLVAARGWKGAGSHMAP